MSSYKKELNDFLREKMRSYRKEHAYSQEHMAEMIRIAPRSYFDQEHGKYGFSALSFVMFLLAFPEEEMMEMLGEIRALLGHTKKDEAARTL
ncbi:MAG TPA: hypothetical protein DF613_03055 [Lachnospiraceae bacterium]|nr:hypothetical protein [Lachnospiraceae bacterium]